MQVEGCRSSNYRGDLDWKICPIFVLYIIQTRSLHNSYFPPFKLSAIRTCSLSLIRTLNNQVSTFHNSNLVSLFSGVRTIKVPHTYSHRHIPSTGIHIFSLRVNCTALRMHSCVLTLFDYLQTAHNCPLALSNPRPTIIPDSTRGGPQGASRLT